MIGKILVPTDGSPLSEGVIPLVEDIATAQHAKVVLVRVVSPPTYLVAQDATYFDPDIYRIVRSFIEKHPRAVTVVPVSRLHSESFAFAD